MCDSPVVQSAFNLNDSISQISCSSNNYYDSDSQLEIVDELRRDDSSLEVLHCTEEVESLGFCAKSANSYPNRLQLEQDVQRLQQKLQEEMELHAILENSIKKNAVKLSSPSCLPHHAQELLSNIAVLEITVSKLEQEMISLHFQLSQERNERRLAEYRLKHSSSLSLTSCSFDNMETPILSSMKPLRHLKPELVIPQKIIHAWNRETNRRNLLGNHLNADIPVVLFHKKKQSVKTDSKSSQPVEFRKIPTGMPQSHKGLWDHPNQLSEEMVRCMKNIFMSLADSSVPSKSSALESHCSSQSPRGHLSNSSWWSSSERSMISSWVPSPQIDIQSNCGVLASENVFDPYRVRGKGTKKVQNTC
ncbi:hypothetical protein LWI29_008084 [Acer saccharum]|uniref:Ternary complex factor MIP1 leucine-zipper domain-containing protein n=1 Tax=Acer saccharum TaxID=4024 RepID=A0AA39SRQ7_ACESA|nr:hypothetical protein LWI29_008084 [Acer saccharum]